MPLPSPRLSGDSPEKKSAFISRCMGDSVMRKEWPKQENRAGVCYSIWERAVKKKRAKGSEEEPTWEEIQAEIEQSGTIQCDGTLKIINLPKL